MVHGDSKFHLLGCLLYPLEVTMPLIEVDGASLYYELTGPDGYHELTGPTGAPVLMLSNSLGTTHHMWDPQLEQLQPHFRLLRYDMRGHGASSVTAGEYTIDLLGRDVLALLDALHLQTVDFCGLSIGGIIGQWLGIHAPSRLRRLVLCNTAASIGTAETWNKRIAEVQRDGMEPIADAVLQRWFTPSFLTRGARIIMSMREMLTATNPTAYTAACAAIRDVDLRDAVSGIHLPVCIVAGEQDIVTTVTDAQFLQSRIHGAELHTLPTAHISSAEVPQKFSALVLNFLTQDVSL